MACAFLLLCNCQTTDGQKALAEPASACKTRRQRDKEPIREGLKKRKTAEEKTEEKTEKRRKKKSEEPIKACIFEIAVL